MERETQRERERVDDMESSVWLCTGGSKVASNLCRFVRENPPELELQIGIQTSLSSQAVCARTTTLGGWGHRFFDVISVARKVPGPSLLTLSLQ